MDKNTIKETMLSLEGAVLKSAREKYFDYLLMLGSTEANRSKVMSRPKLPGGQNGDQPSSCPLL